MMITEISRSLTPPLLLLAYQGCIIVVIKHYIRIVVYGMSLLHGIVCHGL